MPLQASFDILSQVVERYETGGRTVRHVEVTTDEERDGLRVSMEIPVSLCAASDDRVRSALTPETASLTGGGIRVEFSTSPLASLPQSTAAAVSASEEAVRVVDDDVMLSVELAIDPTAADQCLNAEQERPERSSATASSEHVAGFGAQSSNGTTVTGPSPRKGPPDSGQPVDEGRSVDEGGPTDAGGPVEAAVRATHGASDDERAGHDERAGYDEGSTVTDSIDGREAELAAVRDESVPPYDDRDYLARLYDLCDTFTEMSRVIEMDVSSETVRRYMIEADVHSPATYEVAQSEETNDEGQRDDSDGADDEGDSSQADREGAMGAGESQAPTETDQNRRDSERDVQTASGADDPIPDVPDEQLVTDGSGLPSGVELRDVADAVVESATVYEIQRRLELDRDRTLDLLKRLDLVDFATGRVADQPDRSVSYEQVAARIRDTAPGEA